MPLAAAGTFTWAGTAMSAIGSVWQKWDLHIHTPASFHWDGQRFHQMNNEKRDAACKKIVEKIKELDVVVFCIMDY
jgi:hypothetical protein